MEDTPLRATTVFYHDLCFSIWPGQCNSHQSFDRPRLTRRLDIHELCCYNDREQRSHDEAGSRQRSTYRCPNYDWQPDRGFHLSVVGGHVHISTYLVQRCSTTGVWAFWRDVSPSDETARAINLRPPGRWPGLTKLVSKGLQEGLHRLAVEQDWFDQSASGLMGDLRPGIFLSFIRRGYREQQDIHRFHLSRAMARILRRRLLLQHYLATEGGYSLCLLLCTCERYCHGRPIEHYDLCWHSIGTAKQDRDTYCHISRPAIGIWKHFGSHFPKMGGRERA